MNLSDFHFIRPFWLLALIPAIVLAVLLLRSKLRRGVWSSVCDAALLPYVLQEKTGTASRWPLAIGTLAALLAIVALAGPTWQRLPTPVFRNASALVLALDLSRSMDAEDVKPSRLIRARYKIADILKQRKDGQTALLVYAGDAFTVTPLTEDIETIASQLSALTTDIMPSQGSNTALVLAKAADLFKQAGQQQGQIVLITDGVDAGQMQAGINALDSFQLSVLGVGTADGAPIPLANGGGFMKDPQGTIVIPKLNVAELRELAQAGHGVYQTITANDADIQTLLATVNKPVQQQGQGKENKDYRLEVWNDQGPWLLIAVLPLAALLFRKGVLCLALLLLLPLPKNSYAFEWQDLWQTKDQQAQQAYRNKQFEDAANLFENPEWQAAANYKAGAYNKAIEKAPPESGDGLYNQGNALAQAGKLEEAIKAYEKALAKNPDNVDAKYNKELVEKELEKQKKQQEQQQQQKDNKPDDKEKSQQDENKDKGQKGKEGNGDKEGESSDQADNNQKPEQKPERPGNEQGAEQPQDSAENKAQEQKSDAQQTKEQKSEAQKAEEQKAAAQQQAGQQDKDDNKAKEASAAEALSAEQQQANEQWLNRIPDDPSGLLKRKFKYQYGQRNRQTTGDEW
ncbi:MAG: VWA domain-containing protein [Methylovulum sp.]|nr:VWA domain-containing protein [Methylovulum sp.]